ncbi:MAG: hypothetical protein MjAS7_1982 [Metallosphaera javensis (ex Sakai et al. 2022)]|nr:MAG: hypothetical protein MjAS7_1982 [Metallosphaera javensis (ex Sakai et al. 2022)]
MVSNPQRISTNYGKKGTSLLCEYEFQTLKGSLQTRQKNEDEVPSLSHCFKPSKDLYKPQRAQSSSIYLG